MITWGQANQARNTAFLPKHFVPAVKNSKQKMTGYIWGMSLKTEYQAWCTVLSEGSGNSVDQGLDQQTVSVKDQEVNFFCSVGHMVSVATTRFCP